ncbi:MAG: BREX-1 system adenine-specific DNA-methyltransferase PglX [Anaerocolumna sp.]
MDKTAIKNYAVAARRKLMDAVRTKMAALYIFENYAEPSEAATVKLRADGIFLTDKQMEARKKLCAYLAQLNDEMDNEKAFSHVLEEVAYTWFNRLIGLRYMEINEYLPSGIRVLSSVESGRVEPDAMREAERLPFVNQNKIFQLRSDTSPGASEKLYKYILISQCNALHDILPSMFQKINDYTELLLPDSLFQKGGVVYDLVNAIKEDDFRDQVQIIGWLYQYYISEKKDEVFAALKRNVKINKETIPAATQLFTPEWIVKYMVENSLGRLWLERDKEESDLSSDYMNASYYGWRYYIEEAEQEPEVTEKLMELRKQSRVKHPEDIKIIDPCMGSGHILVYAFDVLYQIYVSQGYAEREIPGLILQNNIYGLDIDGRAAQLAYFALMMKARSYNRRFFRPRNGENIPQPHVHAVIESDGVRQHHLNYMGYGMSDTDQKECKDGFTYLVDLFSDAREYGSILKIEQNLEYNKLRCFAKAMQPGQIHMDAVDIEQVSDVLLEILDIAQILNREYDVVVTNPPYMTPSVKQSEYAKKHYPYSKTDLFAVFIERCSELNRYAGFQGMVTMQSWMSLSSYTKLRAQILNEKDIINMAHLGARAFEEISGEVVQTTAFVFRARHIAKYQGVYFRLTEYSDQNSKESAFLKHNNQYIASNENFERLPNTPITAYWVSKEICELYGRPLISSKFDVREGVGTRNDEVFIHMFWEVRKDKIGKNLKWILTDKAGTTRKWYLGCIYIMDWEDDGYRIRNYRNEDGSLRSRPQNLQYLFRDAITWGKVGTGTTTFRYRPTGYAFNDAAPSAFGNDLFPLLASLNSKLFDRLLKIRGETMNVTCGVVGELPLLGYEEQKEFICKIVEESIRISQVEWDSFETSWDFKIHPFITFKGNYEEAEPLLYADDIVEGPTVVEWSKEMAPIAQAFEAWERFTDEQFAKLKSNEEELNRIFFDIYGLQDELGSEVEDKDVTVRKADLGRDIRSFMSYAVGCMFGRYSLDEQGQVFAGGVFDMSHYKIFLPEDDDILPIGSADYFDDDIVVRFTEFVRIIYGDATLDENLNFIADALYPNANGSAKDRIRRYFLSDFYKDHLKIYQKRPIYWLLDSGKKDGFKALFYLHRYDKYTVARVRTDYLHPLQRKYEAEISRWEMLSSATDNAREKATYRKEIESLQSKIEECRTYDQIVAHIAHRQIELELDDGVKVNYAKFQDVEVPLDNGKTIQMDLLSKI